jgi:hypothetical protein
MLGAVLGGILGVDEAGFEMDLAVFLARGGNSPLPPGIFTNPPSKVVFTSLGVVTLIGTLFISL